MENQSEFLLNMSVELPEAKADTLQEVFSDKFQYINLDHYNIYHFEEILIDGRRYQFRLSSKGDLMTVVTHIAGRAVLLVSVWTNMDYEKRLREIHQHILEMERTGTIPIDFRDPGKWRDVREKIYR
ncbi:fungal specific transcription [Schistosoma japonicum]|nr:fungal specific transcription [Schistosoma japonicum]